MTRGALFTPRACHYWLVFSDTDQYRRTVLSAHRPPLKQDECAYRIAFPRRAPRPREVLRAYALAHQETP